MTSYFSTDNADFVTGSPILDFFCCRRFIASVKSIDTAGAAKSITQKYTPDASTQKGLYLYRVGQHESSQEDAQDVPSFPGH